ncbi:MAG: hypothetical protein GY859_28720 [Desulfobacterales bacterium]|nr:hypothetical protein [Desulfobacterales bacterium]
MTPTNLIFIDGAPGSGKSTTAQLLCLNLRRNGRDARWVYEDETPHPIYEHLGMSEIVQFSDPGPIFSKALSNWKTLAASLEKTDKIVILESALFQVTAGAMQLLQWEKDKILAHILRIQDAVSSLNPVMIHLCQDDPAGARRRICDRRGPEFQAHLIKKIAMTPYGKHKKIETLDHLEAVFRDHERLTDFLFSRLKMKKITMETGRGDWEGCYEKIASFLNTPPIVETRPPVNALADFTGKYRVAGSGQVIPLAHDEKNLHVDDESATRLIHKENNTFFVEGVHAELSFLPDENGAIEKAAYSENPPDVDSVWTKEPR